MKKNILISLIIPIYKVEDYIYQCLNSIISQISDKECIEIVVVNDGTPDNSMDIVRSFASYSQLRIIEQKNQGLSVARNTGLEYAKGEYVWFIDSDDWLLPNAIEYVLSYIDKYPDVPVFSTILEKHIEKQNKIVPELSPNKKALSRKDYLLLKYEQGASQRYIFKKSFLAEHNLSFYPGILHEDGLFGYQMLYWADKIIILERPVYAYRIRQEGSIMSSISIRTPKDMLLIHKQLMFFCENSVVLEDKFWYRLRVFSILINLFQFSINLAFSDDFSTFYRKNKAYINKELDFIIKNKSHVTTQIYRKSLILRFLPLAFMKLKYVTKIILKKSRK